MGFRFQKRVGFPFGRINLPKSGASLSMGVRGAHVTLGRTPRLTVGLPGSGLSWTSTLPHGDRSSASPVALFFAGLLGLGIGFAILSLFVAFG